MAEVPRLRLVDDAGELAGERGCDRCQDVHVEDVENLEKLVRSLNRKIANMERDRDAERMADPDRALVVELFELWKDCTGHTRSMLGPDRFDSIKAALKLCRAEHGPERGTEIVRLAIEGIAAFPYVVGAKRVATGPKGARHDRLGIALDGSEAIERFANLGHEARKQAEARRAA